MYSWLENYLIPFPYRFKGLYFGFSKAVRPSWAPCWPHELCYQRYYGSLFKFTIMEVNVSLLRYLYCFFSYWLNRLTFYLLYSILFQQTICIFRFHMGYYWLISDVHIRHASGLHICICMAVWCLNYNYCTEYDITPSYCSTIKLLWWVSFQFSCANDIISTNRIDSCKICDRLWIIVSFYINSMRP